MDDKELRFELKDIKVELGHISKQLAVNNHILNEHHKRSTLLEERVKPLEDDYTFRNKARNLLLGSGGIVAFVILVINFLRK